MTDSSAGTASNIFSTQASYILPYTKGSSFTHIENAYFQNGIGSVYNAQDASNTTNQESRSIINDLKDSASKAAQDISRAVEDSNFQEKVKDVWNSLKDYFR